MATDVSSDDWNQPRCWSEPSRYRSAGNGSSGALLQHAVMRHAGIEPDVQGVADLVVVARPRRPAARRGSSSNQASMPSCSTRCATSSISRCRVADAARRSPGARTARSARPRCAGGRYTSPAGSRPCPAMRAWPQSGIQLTPAIAAQRRVAQAVLLHADEPLRRGAEDDRRLVPPAVRIAVAQRLVVQQRAARLEHLDDTGHWP